jgi:arylsulfatase A-like enzyme
VVNAYEWHDNSIELYDHQSDPYEYRNLAGDSAQREQLAAMKQQLRAGWQAALPRRSD